MRQLFIGRGSYIWLLAAFAVVVVGRSYDVLVRGEQRDAAIAGWRRWLWPIVR